MNMINAASCTKQHAAVCQGLQGVLSPSSVRRPVAACSLTRRSEDVKIAKTAVSERDSIRLGIPSKGRMAEETLELLNTCQLKCVKPNPRQYYGQIRQFPEMEVWFQRASDVVRKLRTCDLDLGIVGMDMFAEFAAEDKDLVVVHDALAFGHCKLALGVPIGGEFTSVATLEDLKGMGWSEERPLRVVTAYINIAQRCEHCRR
jgi:ATP phosphoribosyltransferase